MRHLLKMSLTVIYLLGFT